MRYGVLSDIHGNRHALDAALGVLEEHGVDGYICAGDLVGYGPYPNECVARVVDLGAVCVAGNHDLMAVGRVLAQGISGLARSSLEWTSGILGDDARDYLSGLPETALVGDRIVVGHGSLNDPSKYILSEGDARHELDQLQQVYPSAETLILGHTHLPFLYDHVGGRLGMEAGTPLALRGYRRRLLNPGSVGQSRERSPWDRFMLLDLETEEVTAFAIPYDVDGCRRDLVRKGRPPGSCHLPPASPARRAVRKLRRLTRTSSKV